MRVALGADHAGVALKGDVKAKLEERGVEIVDFGAIAEDSVDYPDYAVQVAEAVASHTVDYGILVCGTGLGMAIAANKVSGIRAIPVIDIESARLGRQHNNANVLALGARITPKDDLLTIVETFLDTPFEGGRHKRRVDKIAAIESHSHKAPA